MTRSQAAYLRSIKARLAKMGASEKMDTGHAMRLYDAWVKPAEAASILAGKAAA